eukprot:8405627-Heterocapsa_arctica.AAC.1
MFPERWLAANYRRTRRSRLDSRRTSSAEGCWPRKNRPELPGTTSWDVAAELQAGTALSHGERSRCRGAEKQKRRRRESIMADGKERRSARTRKMRSIRNTN